VAPNKRGVHLALSLERLDALAGRRLTRIGLSATQRPVGEVARFLVGAGHLRADGSADCVVIDTGHMRSRDLAIEVPPAPLEAVMSGEVWERTYDRLATLIGGHRTTLVFVNTRRMAERVARHLSERVGAESVTAHHGSMAREARLDAEQRLKRGELRALVATASLELGIDIGEVDLVCQLGSPRSIAAFLQRVGRSGHAVGGTPKGRLFPLSRDDLAECTALLDCVRRGELELLRIPTAPLDVLAQQVVAEVAAQEWAADALYDCLRRAWPYRDLARREYDEVVRMLAEGYTTRRGRRGALLHHDAVAGMLRARRGARLTALTSGGTIPDTADYQVILEPDAHTVGTVNEDFAVESLAGDVFQLGNAAYRILRIERGTVRVEDAKGAPPNIPFWFGEAPGRSDALSFGVARLRQQIAAPLERGEAEAAAWLSGEIGLDPAAARQLADYLGAARRALGALPTQATVILERFFDETGGAHLVVHSPHGSRINRAWGLALRKRFCRKFNFELQAAATEDCIVLSLTHAHSFPLDEVRGYLRAATVREVLVQALLAAPMFLTRWRWDAAVALALPRMRGGRKVPPQLQRMEAEDLVAAVFPDQLACAENLAGEREVPDHPLVRQTIRDCLEEAMDIDGLTRLLEGIESGEVQVLARDLTEPSPLALEVLSARPYAFLDDAPLEERRTQAVMSRRWLDPESAADIGRLDPEAIERVRQEAWPDAENADELHDALLWLGGLTESEARANPAWPPLLDALARAGRATRLVPPGAEGQALWIAAERLPPAQAVHPGAALDPSIAAPPPYSNEAWSRDDALRELVRGRLEGLGPVTAAALAAALAVPAGEIDAALAALEVEGFALRGRYTEGARAEEWCERRLLARIHRYTVNRLRAEIEPVPARELLRFLFEWQRVAPGARMEGPDAVAAAAAQLEGFEAPAGAWETEILPARIADYEPRWLDDLCLAGRVAWQRLSARRSDPERGATPVRSTPVVLLARRNARLWSALGAPPETVALSSQADRVFEALRAHGASFFDELVDASGLLRSQVESALAELVAHGLVSADSFAGLRALLVPSERRKPYAGGRRKRRSAAFAMEDAGRWTLARRTAAQPPGEETVEHVARVLLRRWGVVFWRLLAREADWLPPWRDLLRCLRRLEARGEIRGGRFVAGFSGEQFALPEAVGLLRETRRRPADEALVSLSAADPLNLVGLLTPGARLPALTANRVLYRGGLPVALLAGGEVRFLVPLAPAEEWQARNALLRRHVPAALADFS
jgi:ATP-dependent Lhr-like helicase